MTLGMGLMGVGLVALAVVGGDGALVDLQVNFALLGLGLALNTGAVVGVALNSVGQGQAGLASGVVNLARLFGATLGVALPGAIVAASEGPASGSGPRFLAGFSIALGVDGALEIAGGLLSWYGIKDHQGRLG
jgi:hypothetical protein